jgi:hypothetical protein
LDVDLEDQTSVVLVFKWVDSLSFFAADFILDFTAALDFGYRTDLQRIS